MNRRVKQLSYDSIEKNVTRETIANYISPGKCILDFFGSMGEMYWHIKRNCIDKKIYSIDTGKSFHDEKRLEKLFRNSDDRELISLGELIERQDRKFQVAWLDYCGELGMYMWKDLKNLHKIMEDEGYIFITYCVGHEKNFAKGTPREIIDGINIPITEFELEQGGIKLMEKVMDKHYYSQPIYSDRKSNRRTPMVVIGWRYKKII